MNRGGALGQDFCVKAAPILAIQHSPSSTLTLPCCHCGSGQFEVRSHKDVMRFSLPFRFVFVFHNSRLQLPNFRTKTLMALTRRARWLLGTAEPLGKCGGSQGNRGSLSRVFLGIRHPQCVFPLPRFVFLSIAIQLAQRLPVMFK